ncbi:MAG: GTPase HflX [Acidobacteria bacterium]|nr:GTPase HflX [Acidobacteriota bacterium]
MAVPGEPALRGGAYLVGVARAGAVTGDVEEHVDELAALADTAGFGESGRAILPLRVPTPATFIGRGQAEDVGVIAREMGASLVVVDEDLGPAQVRNLEKIFDLPVVDRAGLIIDIFAQRARSREARLQVEMARLEYLLPRLAGRWAHLSRQVGGGRGGLKGEGEKQIELDRRMIRRRIDHLRRDLKRVDRSRDVRRRARRALPEAALVGYTNAGKSSLFNALARSNVKVEDRLFATLDPTVRRVDLGRRGTFLLKDTVGFIRKLPHHLVASFRSTFEEAGEAELLVLVVDLAHPASAEQQQVAERVIEETGLGHLPRLLVFNKADLAGAELVRAVEHRHPQAVVVSARTGAGLDHLAGALADRLLGREITGTVTIPAARGDALAFAQRSGVVERLVSVDGLVRLTLRAPQRAFTQLDDMLRQERRDEGARPA